MKSLKSRVKILEDQKLSVAKLYNNNMSPDLAAKVNAFIQDQMYPDEPDHLVPWEAWSFERTIGFIDGYTMGIYHRYFINGKIKEGVFEDFLDSIKLLNLITAKLLTPWLRYKGIEVPKEFEEYSKVDNEDFKRLVQIGEFEPAILPKPQLEEAHCCTDALLH